ncbi:serine/threonine-protein kinase PknK [Novipirellula sp. SH528]|uniref:serine/threonine-protein kinase n=1 Tax=Novipirellula sp. SH528 TaxID=3454466 RepID=UPI003F9F8296
MARLRDNDEFFPSDPSSDTKIRDQEDRETHLPDAPSDRIPPPWKPGDQLGPFMLQNLLGKGSSGYVYRARDEVSGRHCALKLLLPAKCENLVRNKLGFRRMIPLRHPGLIHLDRIHYLDDYIAFSMEEVKGRTFALGVWDICKQDDDGGYKYLLTLIRQYASALSLMHSRGLVHRDIKPQNLMIDSKGHGRVIDYGLVGTIDFDSDPNGYRDYLVGPPHFFAPESLWDQYYLPASDVFSLGLVLLDALRVLDGSVEHLHLSLERSQDNRRDDEAMISEAVGDLSSDVPSVLREACAEMLQRDPGDRPTAAQLSRLGSSASPCVLWVDSPIIGRDVEIGQACDWIDDIFSGGVGRLHIEGSSGIGKSRFVDELAQYIHVKRWGQLFRAKCRSGEDLPMQAFDEICDAIATRYMKNDRDTMELDPASAAFLHDAFPMLKSVMKASTSVDLNRKSFKRLDAIEAGVRLSEALRTVGPLILMIDDVQWVDRDSLNVLDRLQSVSGGMLGIITVSRPNGDRQASPPHLKIKLDRLTDDAARELLMGAARRWSAQLDYAAVDELIQAAQGSPLRLVDFIEEFRPGGVLHHTISGEESKTGSRVVSRTEQLWQMRVARLSDEAKHALSFIVTSGHLISAEQLSELTGLGESIDAVLSELVQQRLVRDEVTGGECISIFHDSIADNLATTLSDTQKRECHAAWARLLSRQDLGGKLAARIARHFFDADEPNRAVSYAILAAENAERYQAKTESARWHARVIDHVSGPERIERIRVTAETFAEADRPVDAAHYFQLLASELVDEESVKYQLRATTLLIRSGYFSEVRDQLQRLTRLLRLPSAKPRWLSKINILRLLANNVYTNIRYSNQKVDASTDKVSVRDRQRLELCLSVARPLSMYDNLHATELNITAANLAQRYGSEADRILVEVGVAVFGTYNHGSKRIRSEVALQDLLPRAIATKDLKVIGDVWAGIAFSQALAMRWSSVAASVDACVQHYNELSEPLTLEVCHLGSVNLLAHWHVGHWTQLMKSCDQMLDDFKQRNDQFQWIIASSGCGASTWLMRDQVVDSEQVRHKNAEKLAACDGAQLFDFLESTAQIHLDLYKGHYDQAWQRIQELRSSRTNLSVLMLQSNRVMLEQFVALVALHRLKKDPAGEWGKFVESAIRHLHREHSAFAKTVAHFYEGLLLHLKASSTSDFADARKQLVIAWEMSKEQRLRPYQLAAEDVIATIDNGESPRRLIARMERHGVVDPLRFSRLYTI